MKKFDLITYCDIIISNIISRIKSMSLTVQNEKMGNTEIYKITN